MLKCFYLPSKAYSRAYSHQVLRTYIIWDKNRKVIILPTLLLITDIRMSVILPDDAVLNHALVHSVQMIIVLATNIKGLLGPATITFSTLSWAMNLSCSGT